MRVKLLVATGDGDYAEHLSDIITKLHGDIIDVSVCLSSESMNDLLANHEFDAALLDAPFAEGADLGHIALPLLLISEDEHLPGALTELGRVIKYQRVSTLIAKVLELCAKTSDGGGGEGPDRGKARITAVWSPAGGVGKTTVALAYATKRLSEGKQVLYLNLESFSSVPAYFEETGKGISAIFEMLDNKEGNIKVLIMGIRRQDSGGISYFCRPDNFDDMNVLSVENVTALIGACAEICEELVVDLTCICDERTRQVFELADRVLLVADPTTSAHYKLAQFTSQHNAFERIREKAVFVANKGSAPRDLPAGAIAYLPIVQSGNPTAVYKTLSSYSFGE